MTGISHSLREQSEAEAFVGVTVMDLSMKSSKDASRVRPSKARKTSSTSSTPSSSPKQCLSPQHPASAIQQKFFRPWECQPRNCWLCGKTFSRKSDLQRHVKTKHSDENQTYQCRLCEEKFTRKDNLTRHLKTMHHVDDKLNAKPHCKFCNKRLSRKDAVKRHEKSCKSDSTKSIRIAGDADKSRPNKRQRPS